MGYMDALWTELARHALAHHAQPSLSRGKLGIVRLAADAPVKITLARPCGTMRRTASRPTRKSGEPADAPKLFKYLGLNIAKVDPLIVARVEHHQVGDFAIVCVGERMIEELDCICFTGGVGHYCFGTSAAGPNSRRHCFDFLESPPGDDHVVALGRLFSADRGTQALFCPNTDDDCDLYSHECLLLLRRSLTEITHSVGMAGFIRSCRYGDAQLPFVSFPHRLEEPSTISAPVAIALGSPTIFSRRGSSLA
jgi:hypothetical protein